MKGYCLQFDRDDVVGLLEREALHRHYALLDLAKVRYGIDEAEDGYLELRYQLVQHLLGEVHRAKAKLKPDYEGRTIQVDPKDPSASPREASRGKLI
jgi:hypothetical protein